MAESKSEANASQPVAVLPALSKAFKKSKRRNPSLLQPKRMPAFISRPWSLLKSPKLIAALATACLAFIIIYHGINDPEIFKQFKVINKKIAVQKEKPTKPDLKQPDISPKADAKAETPL
jgi:hypothetical protein